MKVGKQFSFDAAHQLVGHFGKCANLHGHTYKVEVVLTGSINDSGSSEGMVVDFYHVKFQSTHPCRVRQNNRVIR